MQVITQTLSDVFLSWHRSPGQWVASGILLGNLLPWLCSLEMGEGKASSRGRRALRLLTMLWLADRLMNLWQLWIPLGITCAGIGGWFHLRRKSETKPETGLTRVNPGLLWLGLCLTLGAASAMGIRLPGIKVVTSSLVVGIFYLTSALLPAMRWIVRYESTSRADGWKPRLLGVVVCGLYLGCCSFGLSPRNYLLVLGIGIAGWLSLAFIIHRKPRTNRVRRSRIESSVAMLAWAMVVVQTPLIPLELYFRYLHVMTDNLGLLHVCDHWIERYAAANSWGYRDVEYEPIDPSRDRPRVVLLGDSIVFGFGINDRSLCFGPLLEKAMSTSTPNPPQVFSLGVSGATTLDMSRVFNADGVRLSPNIVVWAYCMNDLANPRRQRKPGRLLTYMRELNTSSFSLEFLSWHAAVMFKLPPFDVTFQYAQAYADADMFEVHRRQVLELRDSIRDHGAQIVVVIFPFCVEDPSSAGMHRATEKMAALFQAEGLPVVNVGDFVDVTDPRFQVNRFDSHPNSEVFQRIVPSVAALVLERLPRGSLAVPTSIPGD